MFLIVGLGNPGAPFEGTRHNVGYMLIDYLFEHAHAVHKGAEAHEWKEHKKCSALVAETTLNGVKVLLAKPLTFMNESGRAVGALVRFFKLKKEEVVVAHDDIDLPLGTFKLQYGRGAAGHHGVESVIKAIRTKNIWRLRVGTAPKTKKPADAARFVLQKFSKPEQAILHKVLCDAQRVIASPSMYAILTPLSQI